MIQLSERNFVDLEEFTLYDKCLLFLSYQFSFYSLLIVTAPLFFFGNVALLIPLDSGGAASHGTLPILSSHRSGHITQAWPIR